MTGSQLSIALSLYIISIALAFIFSILKKLDDVKSYRLPVLIHVSLFIFFISILMFIPHTNIPGYAFLILICNGVITAGYLLRSRAPILIRIYFSMFLLSVIVFAFSPSLLVRAITLNLDLTERDNHFRLTGNYYLEQEKLMLNVSDTSVAYKITQHFGIFHKTFARKIRFGGRIDSLKILTFNPGSDAWLRGYLSEKSTTFDAPESLDLHIVFNLHQDEITRKSIYK